MSKKRPSSPPPLDSQPSPPSRVLPPLVPVNSDPLSPALKFTLLGTHGRARAALVELPHGKVETPVFMPVGTYGSMKGLSSEELDQLGPQIILANTYHLGDRPGKEHLKDMEGLHNFMQWPRNLLTDSGGFQMVSLLKLLTMDEEGVRFQSPVDGSEMLLTPELSMEIQNCIGADIMMALDDVISSTSEDLGRMEEATHRTLRWLDRCIKGHKKPHEQNLFAIVQGGLDRRLRALSLKETAKRNTPGFAIGGLSGGESKDKFWRVVEQCTSPSEGLPPLKPRYLMGVGYHLDIVVCVALGVDMFDCVYPTRTARFGTALVRQGQLRLGRKACRADLRVIDPACGCATCKEGEGYSRAYLSRLAGKDPTVAKLVTIHNLHFMLGLMKEMREAIKACKFDSWVREYLSELFPPGGGVRPPKWAEEALEEAGISLESLGYKESDQEGRDMPLAP